MTLLPSRRVLHILMTFPAVVLLGTLGFVVIESWSVPEAFYMAVITVTTVGFGEVHPLSAEGRLFTTFLIFMGIGAITYTFTSLTNYIVTGEFRGELEGRRMKREIDALTRHFVVCGYGEMGRQVCNELQRTGHAFVVIDRNPEVVAQAVRRGCLAVQGDAGLDPVLRESGIERARGLVVATDDDATNLLVVLSARALMPSLSIIARANLEEVTEKLLRAGANRVIFPQSIAGRRMAQMLLHPEISDFLDVITHEQSLELLLESFVVERGSELEDRNLREGRIRELTGVHILGLKRAGKGIIPVVDLSTAFVAGDVVFALGTRESLEQFSMMTKE